VVTKGKEGLYSYQGERRTGEKWRPFGYDHLPAGAYVIVFNRAQQEDPDAPFRRTALFWDAIVFGKLGVLRLRDVHLGGLP
jgi:hypothetical protein